MESLDALLEGVVRQLVEDGAQAVVLCGSHARGQAGPLSDVDLYALGRGPEYQLERVDGTLFSISWRSAADVREAFVTPEDCAATVSGWREARILYDTEGIAARLQEEARAWTWESLSTECDAWVAEAFTGYSEEVQKLLAMQPHEWYSAVLRAVMATRLPVLLAVHFRLMPVTEADTWELVAARMGTAWREAQAAALSMSGEPTEVALRAALDLFELAADEVKGLLDARQAGVVFGALRLRRER